MNANTTQYVETVRERLERARYTITTNAAYAGEAYPLVGHRSGFELSKFGNAEYFAVFGEEESPEIADVRAFGSAAFGYGSKHKRFFMPRGLLNSVYVFPVLLVDDLEDSVANAIRAETPPKHWAAAEMPVVYRSKHNDIVYFEKTPMWGAAYYKTFRKKIQALFAP